MGIKQTPSISLVNLIPFNRLLLLTGLFTFFIYVLLAFVGVAKNYSGSLFFFNLFFSLFYFVLISLSLKSKKFYESLLVFYMLFYTVVGVMAYNYYFYQYSGTFLGFNPSDAGLYYDTAIALSKKSVATIFNLSSYSLFNIDDLGYPIYSALIYKVIPSNLTVNFINVFINIITTVLLYRIGKNILTKKLAFIGSLIYGISSYSIFYQASGLKETLMVFFIISSFYYYTKYIKTNKSLYFLVSILLGFMLMFFRVAIVAFILLSYFINEMIKRRNNIKIILPIIIFSSIGAIFLISYGDFITKFLIAKSYILFSKSLESSYIASSTVKFAYATSMLSGIFGPFPTVLPLLGKESHSIYSSGLILKVFLSSYFLFSLKFAWKEKNHIILPIIIFCLLEITGLAYLLESFELRKAMPHIGLFLLASFYSYEQIHNNYKPHKWMKNLILVFNSVFAVMIIFWNVLRT